MLICTFYQKQFRVLLYQQGQLLFAGYFQFQTAEDLVYHLLNVLQRFELKQENLRLQLNGLIVKDSVLYEQLNMYFTHIAFRDTDQSFLENDAFAQHPSHFFSHLTELMACVL